MIWLFKNVVIYTDFCSSAAVADCTAMDVSSATRTPKRVTRRFIRISLRRKSKLRTWVGSIPIVRSKINADGRCSSGRGVSGKSVDHHQPVLNASQDGPHNQIESKPALIAEVMASDAVETEKRPK